MKIHAIFCVIIVLFCSCNSINNIQNTYENMNIIKYDNNTAYEFVNNKNDRLVISIDGTNWNSVLGWNEGGNWISLGQEHLFLIYSKMFQMLCSQKG